MGYQNFFATKLYTDIGASDTAITLETVPTQTSGRLVLEARNATQREIISYTGITGNQVTGVVRGVGGTTAKPHTRNALVEMNLTAEDVKDLYDAFNTFAATNSSGWYTLASPNVTSVVYNGNRSYTITMLGDRTNLLNPSTRLQFTRTVNSPTQNLTLNGTNQYANRTATINGMSQTDDITAGAWVYLTNYPSTTATIISRYNGTSGVSLQMTATGVLYFSGYNGGVANRSEVNTYQSVPLNRWVHIAATMDLSAFTYTTATSQFYMDGIPVAGAVSRAGTNPTSFVQAGNIEVGSSNGGTNLFPGKIVQAFMSSTKLTPSQILAIQNQGITTADVATYSIISAYSLSGASGLNDINTTNANNLTAQGSAVTTNADAPFGKQASGLISANLDYGIVQSATYSTNTTVVVQVPEGCTIPTSGGISAVSYSGVKAPYGFPADTNKFNIIYTYLGNFSPINATSKTAINGILCKVPIGSFTVVPSMNIQPYRASGTGDIGVTVGIGTTAGTDIVGTSRTYLSFGQYHDAVYTIEHSINASAMTDVYVNILNRATVSGQTVNPDGSVSTITIKNAYI